MVDLKNRQDLRRDIAIQVQEFPMRAVVARYSPRASSSDRLRESEFAGVGLSLGAIAYGLHRRKP
jgi:hypothetical protein